MKPEAGPGPPPNGSGAEFTLPESAWPATLPVGHRSHLIAIREGLRGIPDIAGLAAGGYFIDGRLDEFSDLDLVVLVEPAGSLAPDLKATTGRYPPPDRQWIEDRFWIWVHYAATKLARRELFEVLNFLGFLRAQVLGPLALAEAGAQPNGVRRLEQRAGSRADQLRATVARYDRHDAGRALQAAIALYRELRGDIQPSAAEQPAVHFADAVNGHAQH